MLVNALRVVKSCYFYMKFSRLIQITKPVNTKKAGAALVRTITSLSIVVCLLSSRPFVNRLVIIFRLSVCIFLMYFDYVS